MSRNDDYTTGNLLDYLYHQKDHKLIGLGFSRQINTIYSQQINFTGKLEEDDGATMPYYAFEKQPKTILKSSLD